MRDNKAWEWVREDSLGYDIWDKKYRNDEEDFDSWITRVSGNDPKLANLIRERKFLFGGRILANRGLEGYNSCYSNCFVITPCEDSIESIFDCAKKMARTYSYGGGCGLNIGRLAPRGSVVRNAAKTTSGAVSFMDLYSTVTGLIGQNNRRGALMISMPVDHPDIEEFIECKSDLSRVTKANISVMVTDKFMRAVDNKEMFRLKFTREATGETIEKEVDAYKLFRRIAELNWQMAEPGMLFWDTIEENNLLNMYSDFEYAGVNPCLTGETLVSTVDGAIPIKDLVGKTPVVYCMGDDGTITTETASKVWLTRKDAQVVIIETTRGKIKCTPNHMIRTANRGWIAAYMLCEDDEVLSVRCKELNNPDTYNGLVGSRVKRVDILDKYEDVYDMTVPNLHNFLANGMVVHNCAEEPLPAGGSCLLGSINLSEYVLNPFTEMAMFDFDTYAEDVRTCIAALNTVLDEGIDKLPLEEQRVSARDWRQCGLGFMGLADTFIKMGIEYGDFNSVKLSAEIASCTLNNAVISSAMLAYNYGVFPKFNAYHTQESSMWKLLSQEAKEAAITYGLRNSQLLTCPPCGSISNMIGCSSGIEPIFAKSYTRKTESLSGDDKYYKVYPHIIKQLMKHLSVTEDSLPDYCITAHEIDPMERIDVQAAWQQFIDASISSTINLPEKATVEDVMKIYMEAWCRGLKGVTIYRDNCSRAGILSIGEKHEDDNHYGVDSIPRGYIIDVPEGLTYRKYKLNTGCGTVHLFVGIDEAEGRIYDIFTNVGSSGCVVNTQAISRTISACIRGGIPVEYIVEQLNKAGSCPSWQYAKGKGKNLSKGKSCASAIANVLYDINKEICCYEEEVVEQDSKNSEEYEVCPECGERSLIYNNGCRSCMSCGWSKCG